MAVDTSLAQKYLKRYELLLELYNNYNGTIEKYAPRIYAYDGVVFDNYSMSHTPDGFASRGSQGLLDVASSLGRNAALITQLEYYFRNIPIEDTHAQINLIIQYIKQRWNSRLYNDVETDFSTNIFHPNDSLLVFGSKIIKLCEGGVCLENRSKVTVALCHLMITLISDAGAFRNLLKFVGEQSVYELDVGLIKKPVRGLDSGTVAVLSNDADVDSAVEKIISISEQVPWRLRWILVQESVFHQFKDTLSRKCNLKSKSEDKPRSSDVLCSDTLTYNGRTFVIDPFESVEEKPSVVTVEAYRTTKEMISLVQQDKPRYLSLWMNNIAEINEVTHATTSPVVWVNNVSDFRGPPQVAEAVFSYTYRSNQYDMLFKKCDKIAKLCELSQSWLKLDVESRRETLCSVLEKYISLDPSNKLYTNIKQSLITCCLNTFVDVDENYVCTVMSQQVGIVGHFELGKFLTIDDFKSILQGNAIVVYTDTNYYKRLTDYTIFEQAGVPVVFVGDQVVGDFLVSEVRRTTYRVIWSKPGTIYAN